MKYLGGANSNLTKECGSKMKSTNSNLTKECDCMKRQLQGIALILVSILLMLGYGDVAFFDLSFKWDLIFSVIGITGVIMTFLPDKK